MKRLLILALLTGCATGETSYNTALQEDADRVARLQHHVEALSAEQRRVMAQYAAQADAYKPGIATDLKASLVDTRHAAYTAQLDMVHEFAVVQDKLSNDMVFNHKPAVTALQSEMQGTEAELIAARQEYNFAASVYLQRAKRAKQKPIEVTWYSDHNGSESARSATVFDDDGD